MLADFGCKYAPNYSPIFFILFENDELLIIYRN